ncbi:MAG: DUF1987 domain-containing protein [Halothiobacillaceae bacterium]|nr:DUF1987 domain-containing protein [Halothiobacillaceae bacterium]
MEKIHLPATSNTPEVDFDFQARRLMLRGESYPESAAAFYGDILESTREFLAGLVEQDVIVEVQLTYFNSSSTKMLFGLFEMLNQAAQAGNRVHLHWYYDSEDETILEFGLELREDFPDIEFLPRELEV